MNLNNVRMAPKLWASVLGLLVVMLLSNLWVRSNTEQVLEHSRKELQEIDRKIASVQYLRGTALAASEIGIAQFATNEPRVQAELRKRLTTNAKVTVDAFAEIEKIFTTEGEKAEFAKLLKIRKDLRALREQSEKNLDSDDYNARANFAFGAYSDGADAYYASFDEMIRYLQAQKQLVEQEAQNRHDQSTLVGWAVSGLLLLIGMLLARWLVGTVSKPLQEAVALTESIGDGKLNVSARTDRQDEFGQLLNALSNMAQRLRGVLGEVRTGVDSVSSAAGQIASGNQDLSTRTEQSAASLQQTAASMEEMSASVNQMAETSRQAKQLASTAVQAAERGGEVMQQVVQSMEQINTSSRKIGDIIGVIDGIAFQTNILALNAAVEAARAGEQGRGFAVVAGEVRSLAGRSAEAAKEIKALISDSVSNVDAGSAQVEQAGDSMQQIVGSVRRVTDLIGEITASANEQSDGFGQVNHAVSNLDQMTQQNAALVEESSAAANAMHEQAQHLLQVVSAFDLGHESRQAVAAASVQRPSVAATASAAAKRLPSQRASAQPKAAAPAQVAAPARPAAARAQQPHTGAEDDWETF